MGGARQRANTTNRATPRSPTPHLPRTRASFPSSRHSCAPTRHSCAPHPSFLRRQEPTLHLHTPAPSPPFPRPSPSFLRRQEPTLHLQHPLHPKRQLSEPTHLNAPSHSPKKIHPSPLPGGRLGGGCEATSQHHQSRHAPIAHATPPPHPRASIRHTPAPSRHSCAGRNPPTSTHQATPTRKFIPPPSQGARRNDGSVNTLYEVGVADRTGTGGCSRRSTPHLTSPLKGGRDELGKGWVLRRLGSCLRRNDGKGRRNNGRAHRYGEGACAEAAQPTARTASATA